MHREEGFLYEGSLWLLEEFGERYQVNKLFRVLGLLDLQVFFKLPSLLFLLFDSFSSILVFFSFPGSSSDPYLGTASDPPKLLF